MLILPGEVYVIVQQTKIRQSITIRVLNMVQEQVHLIAPLPTLQQLQHTMSELLQQIKMERRMVSHFHLQHCLIQVQAREQARVRL